ncbi:hypothetical protein [Nitrosomonas sp.]|uniref:hypothetical protein n=1 Tax=Nitrosomonas sp. TaxID=42353 RepID=UPI0025FF23AA|nr:hypothetical protein [Nitrosomonas sp.]MBV6447256.1 hypothetical protein [Nitrosomonas sp.]
MKKLAEHTRWLSIQLSIANKRKEAREQGQRKHRSQRRYRKSGGVTSSIQKLTIEPLIAPKSFSIDDENYDILVWRLNRITTALYRPPLKFLNIPTKKIISFRQKLTANTDKSSFKTQSHNDEIIINIHEAADDLVTEIEIHKYIYFV